VIVINPKLPKSLELKYQSIASNAEFINSSFEDFVENEDLIKKIFTV